jgi:2-polyprenyl-3-methyl-5-hydroxy-6-metoxy-1,4-benzoquinol methylase
MAEAYKHFDARANEYSKTASVRPEFRERFNIFQRRIEATVKEREPSEDNLALDLGCGAGHLTAVLASSGYKTMAFDGSAAMIEVARVLVNCDDVESVNFQQSTLPFGGSQVPYEREASLIVASSVIEYLDDDELFLDQCARMLKNNGKLLASFPNQDAFYWRALSLLRRTGLFSKRDLSAQAHQYTPKSVRVLAKRHDLLLEDFEYFSLPLQRFLPKWIGRRTPRIATMFLAEFRLKDDAVS